MDTEFIILVAGVILAFFGISLYMMNKVMQGLGEIYLKQKQEFMEKIKNPDTLEKHDDRGFTPLMVAFEKRWTNLIPEVLQRILQLKNPLAVINHTNSTGESALHLAMNLGEMDSLNLLLAAGADVNKVRLPEKKTALMDACAFLRVDIVEALLEKGAELDIKDWDDLTVLERFSERFQKQIAKRQGIEYKIYRLLREQEGSIDE